MIRSVKRFVVPLLVVMLLSVFPATAGEPMPFPSEISFIPISGEKPVSISEFKGRPVLMTFWASWCGPCRMELPELAKLAVELEDEGLVFLPVSLDRSPEAARGFLETVKITLPAYGLSDRDQAMLGIQSIPTTILLDGEAVPIRVFTGYSPTIVRAVRAAVEAMNQPKNGQAD